MPISAIQATVPLGSLGKVYDIYEYHASNGSKKVMAKVDG
jgi:hypothetical protein